MITTLDWQNCHPPNLSSTEHAIYKGWLIHNWNPMRQMKDHYCVLPLETAGDWNTTAFLARFPFWGENDFRPARHVTCKGDRTDECLWNPDSSIHTVLHLIDMTEQETWKQVAIAIRGE